LNIFADHHHYDLSHSLGLLFGRRLGHTVIFPIGSEWYERGYWKVFPHLGSVEDHLGIKYADPSVYDKARVMTSAGPEVPDKRFHYRFDVTKGVYQKAVTFEQFVDLPVDILIASLVAHVPAFNELIKKYQPKAKLIFQMGNSFDGYSFQDVKNALNSTEKTLPDRIHSERYSQEFDLDLFSFSVPASPKKVVSFVHYLEELEIVETSRCALPEFSFELYGSGSEGGLLRTTSEVASKMGEAGFIWHLKKCDDGYGHIVHNAAAMGRPLILSKEHYKKLRFGKFIEDGVTCITLDGRTPEILAKKIRYYAEPRRHARMCRSLHERFKKYVNFDRDEASVRRFLENLR